MARPPQEPLSAYRVRFEGPELNQPEREILARHGAIWEGTVAGPAGDFEHSVRLRAANAEAARAKVEGALGPRSLFQRYRVGTVTCAGGREWRGPIDRSWKDVDWSAAELVGLSELQRSVLWALLDDHQTAWIIARNAEVTASRGDIEVALGELARRGLVDSRIARSLDPDPAARDYEPWWAITEHGWEVLQLIRSPGYR